MSLSAFIATSLASVNADLDNETVTSSESGRSSVRTKASHCHPLQEDQRPSPPSEKSKTSDEQQAAAITGPTQRPPSGGGRPRLEHSRSQSLPGNGSTKSLLGGSFNDPENLESQLVTLKYELAQIKSELDHKNHIAERLSCENKQLKADIVQSRTAETNAVQRANELERTVRNLRTENERLINDTSNLASQLSKADSIADAIQCCDRKNDDEMKAVVEHTAQLAQTEHQSITQQTKVENDNLRLFAKKVFVEKKKLTQERNELQGRLNEMMSVSVVNTDVPAPAEKGLRGMLTKMTSNRSVMSSSSNKSSSMGVGVSQRKLSVTNDPVTTMTTVPVESLLWSST